MSWPDGKTVLYNSPDGTCVRGVDGCLVTRRAHAAITDEYGLGLEPDGISLVDPRMPEGAEVDVFPSWSADGEQIRSSARSPRTRSACGRCPPQAVPPARLGMIDTSWDAMVVPTRGGEPVPVADGAVTYPTWAPEGARDRLRRGAGHVAGRRQTR